MNLWKRVRNFSRDKLFGSGARPQPAYRPAPPPARPEDAPDDEPEMVVPELSVDALRAALQSDQPPLVIDVREPYEWRLVRMPDARHIPMNEVPAQLDSLPRDRDVVVMCAHGSRSYSVAAWLIEQGIHAASLAGGITQWAKQGGAVEQGDSKPVG